jgi:hypothetical protein
MKMIRLPWLLCAVLMCNVALGQAPTKKHLLVLGEEKGYRHESVSHAMAVIEHLGEQTGLWDTTIRTDTEALTKKKLEFNAKNLNNFDAILMFTWVKWPEFVDMLGGDFDEHPWLTFDAPIIVEDPAFPGMQQWPHEFVLHDEIYQMKDFSRDKVRVLMRLDPCKLDLKNPKVHRQDHDFAVTWAKSYGKGRVYYSTLGHPKDNWDDPRLQKMYTEAIKWAMGLESADITPQPAPAANLACQ